MKNQNLILYVNPVERISVQGRDIQIYTIRGATGELTQTTSMNKTKEFSVGEEFHFQPNLSTNRLMTGLDEVIPNPFHKAELQDIITKYGLSTEWLEQLPLLLDKEVIKTQTYMEIINGVKPDYYTSHIRYTIFNLPGNVKELPAPSFLEQFKIILYDRPNRFVDDTPRGRLSIKLIKNHPKVAHNKKSVNSAFHHFYISEENEAEVEQNKKADIIKKATYHLYKLQQEDTPYRNYQVATLLSDQHGATIIKGRVAAVKVESALNRYVTDTQDRNQLVNVNKFLTVVDLYTTPEGAEKAEVMYLVQQAINTNVIAIRDGYYTWFSKAGSDPNVYRNSHYDKLLNLLISELQVYIPKDDTVTNWYKELLEEVQAKGAWIE